MKTIVIRINYRTLVKLKKLFPAFPGETMKNYFMRLEKHLKNLKGGVEDGD